MNMFRLCFIVPQTINGALRRKAVFEAVELDYQDDDYVFVLPEEARAKAAAFKFRHLWDVKIDGVLFADMGQVFISDSDLSHEFHVRMSRLPGIFEQLRYSYGTGLRIALGEAILARLDVGFSNEQTGLVYLGFGQTF